MGYVMYPKAFEMAREMMQVSCMCFPFSGLRNSLLLLDKCGVRHLLYNVSFVLVM